MSAKKINIVIIALMIVTMLAGAFTASAQTTEEPTLWDNPVPVVFGGAANLRFAASESAAQIDVRPDTVGTFEPIPAGSLGHLLAETSERSLVRTVVNGLVFTGWVNNDNAALRENEEEFTLPELTCSVGGGNQVQVVQYSDGWVFDTMTSGCDLLAEGRKEETEQHHIWVLRDSDNVNTSDTTNGLLFALEGSVWEYPVRWNIENFAARKDPIAAEFVTAKRENMIANNYDWDIIVHLTSGNPMNFAAGGAVPDVTLPNNASFSTPEVLEVTGVYQEDGTFRASIGAAGARTIALIDGEDLVTWTGAMDNVVFLTIEAYLIPSAWADDSTELASWLEGTFPGMEVEDYDPDARG